MQIGIYISNYGGSPLLTGLMRGLVELGHNVVPAAPDNDLNIIFNQCAHTTAYEYPPFPEGNAPLAFVDCAEYGYFKRLPGVCNDYLNTFSEGSLNHDTKSKDQQLILKRNLEGKSFPYFLREYYKDIDWPTSYHPIDYPLYALSVCNKAPTLVEYVTRPLDLFVFWGGSHPWRVNLTEEMRQCPIRKDINIIHDETNPRRPQDEYFKRTESALCSVSFDGYGSSSFRFTEVLVRAVLLKGPLRIELRDDLSDGINCVEYNMQTEGEKYISSDLNEKILGVVNDPERSFNIYKAGYEHCMEYFTEKATAEYLLRKVEQHDYSKPTPLDL